MDIRDIIIYCVIIFFIVYAVTGEIKDIYSVNNQKGYGFGKGNAYYRYRPLDNDDAYVLMDKIIKTSKYESNSTAWRRCMLVAIISAFLVLLIVQRSLPNARLLAISIFVIFMVTYFMQMNFQRTVSVHAVNQVIEITERLKHKLPK